MSAVPENKLSDPMRRIHAMVRFDHGKGEANAYAEDHLVAIADAFEDSVPDLMAINVWANTGALMTDDLARGERMLERARAAAREIGDERYAVLVESRDSYRAQVNGDPERAAARLREALGLLAHTRWDGVFHLWGNLVWCEVICGRHDEAQQVADEALRRLTHPHLSVNVWEHLVENATASWMLTGHWQRARVLLEESAPWWEDDLRTSNAHLDALDLMQTGSAADVDRWRTQLETPAPSGAALCIVRHLLALRAVLSRDLGAMREDLRPLWASDRVMLDDDQAWETVLMAARAEADGAVAGGQLDQDAGLAHLVTITDVAEKFRRYGVLGEVWPLDLAAQLDRFHGRDARPALRAALAGWERIGTCPTRPPPICRWPSRRRSTATGMRHVAISPTVGPSPPGWRPGRCWRAPRRSRGRTRAQTSRERRTNDVLTEREVEVLGLVADGMTNGQIGACLFMSPKTASVHVSHILAKLGAANRTEAATLARRQGLLPD